DVLHFEWRIVRPEGHLFVERLGQVVGLHCYLAWDVSLARSNARSSARRVSTSANCRRYRLDAGMSFDGSISSLPAVFAPARMASVPGVCPTSDAAARVASSGRSPTPNRPMRAFVHRPWASMATVTATPASAKSPRRRENSRNAEPRA